MDMNTKSNTSPFSELILIGDIGFVFEVNQSIKHNLISPDVLAFFDGVPESGEITKECAFPPAISNTNLRYSIFKNLGADWVVCSDGVFRKCPKIKCDVNCKSIIRAMFFMIDRTLTDEIIAGIVSL